MPKVFELGFLLFAGRYLEKYGAVTGEANFRQPPELEIGIAVNRNQNSVQVVAIDLQDRQRTELKIDSRWPTMSQRELALEAIGFLCGFERLALPYKLSAVREALGNKCIRLTAEPEYSKSGPPFPKWPERLESSFFTLGSHLSKYGVRSESDAGEPTYEVCLSYDNEPDSLGILVCDLPSKTRSIRHLSKQWPTRGDIASDDSSNRTRRL